MLLLAAAGELPPDLGSLSSAGTLLAPDLALSVLATSLVPCLPKVSEEGLPLGLPLALSLPETSGV